MELITSTMTPSTSITSSIVKHAIDTTASSSSSMLPTATVNSQIQSSGKTFDLLLNFGWDRYSYQLDDLNFHKIFHICDKHS